MWQEGDGGDEGVDFVGALEDAVDAGVAIGALRWVLLHEAITTVDLHGLIHGTVQQLRAPDFGDGAFDGIFFDAFAAFARSFRAALANGGERGIDHAYRAIHHGLAALDADS